jgi:hypothetical protein
VRVVHRANEMVLVQLPDGTRGRIVRHELPAHLDPPEGTVLQARVVQLDPEHRNVILSARGLGTIYRFGDAGEESPFAVLQGIVGS